MLLLLHNLSVQTIVFVCKLIIFVGKTEWSLMLLLLYDQSVQTLLIVGSSMKLINETEWSLMLLLLHDLSVWTLIIVVSSMKLIGDAETILDAVTSSQTVSSKHCFCLWTYYFCWLDRGILDAVTFSQSMCSNLAYCWVFDTINLWFRYEQYPILCLSNHSFFFFSCYYKGQIRILLVKENISFIEQLFDSEKVPCSRVYE